MNIKITKQPVSAKSRQLNGMWSLNTDGELIRLIKYSYMNSIDICGETWHNLTVYDDSINEWIMSKSNELWSSDECSLGYIKFLVHDKLYKLFLLKWS